MFWFYLEILIFVLFHLLLCLNQRLQIFHNDGFEVFHSFFLLRETKELAAEYSEGSGSSQTPIDRSHLKPADFFTYSFGDLFKVSFSLLDLPLQLKHRKHGTIRLPSKNSFGYIEKRFGKHFK